MALAPPSISSPTSPVAPEELVHNATSKRAVGVTPRVVVVCLLIAAFFAWAIPIVDYKFSNTFLGATHLAPGAVAVLILMLLVANPLLALLGHRYKFSRDEILTVYLSCLFSCLVPGIGGNNYFVSFIIGAYYFATRENGWMETLQKLPSWMTPALGPNGVYRREIVEGWYVGLKAGQPIPWDAWLTPLLAWGALFFASFMMMGCLSVMLRAQWGDHEALSFPMMRLSLEMTEDVDRTDKYGIIGRFFRNPLMWSGFVIAVWIQTQNGLNGYFPDVPIFPLEINTGPMFTEAPWNQMGGSQMKIYPVAVGISYLLTSEISFSLWFFYWFFKFQYIVSYLAGFPPNSLPNNIANGQKLFTNYQEMGAHLMFVALIIWTARQHFGHILQRALGRVRARPDERNEPLSYPVAFWGFVLSFAFMVGWTVHAGVHPLIALALWASYLVIAIVLSRVVAAGGLLFVHHSWMPLGAFAQLVGSGPGSWLSPANGIAVASVLEMSCIQDYRASLMPSFVQTFKVMRDRNISPRPLMALIVAVILVGMVVGIHMNVRLGYENGGLQLQGWISRWGPQSTGHNAHAIEQAAPDVGWSNWFWLFFGAALTFLLTLGQARLLNFPLHAMGYVMALTYPASALWFSIFLAWLIKSLVTRFGGVDSYRKLTPAFLGLALGDVCMMLFWICIDCWQGRMGHQLMPG